MKLEEAMKLVEALNDALRAGHSETLKEFLATMARFHNYSIGNALLIAVQKPEATHVAGFGTWKKLGTRETEAEAVAYAVCVACGIDSRTRSADYIQLYRGNEETLKESLTYVQQIASEIIAGLSVRNEKQTLTPTLAA